MTLQIPHEYSVTAIGPENVSSVSAEMYRFWANRDATQIGPDLLEGYRLSMFKDYQKATRGILGRLCRQAIARNGSVSVLDIGCANGTVGYWLRSTMPKGSFRYVGIDPSPMFIDDAKANLADHFFVVAACRDLERIPLGKFDIAFISGVLCFVPPDEAMTALRKAADCAPFIVLRDFFGNASERTIGAFYFQVGFPMFAHPYEAYLAGLGMRALERHESRTADDRRGWGVALIAR